MPPDLQAADLMTKFASQPRPAGHNAARVRNNQRRHRARVKAHVADLEAQLEETRAQLDSSLARISQLTAELEALRRRPGSPARADPETLGAQRSPDAQPKENSQTSVLSSLRCCANQSAYSLEEQRTWNAIGALGAGELSLVTAEVFRPFSAVRREASVATGPSIASSVLSRKDQSPAGSSHGVLPPCHFSSHGESIHSVSDTALVPDFHLNDLPPPGPGESTTACSNAYKIIEQQNLSGWDVAAITSWLKPGFRRAIKQGDGCRVETHLLFALLDYISSFDGL